MCAPDHQQETRAADSDCKNTVATRVSHTDQSAALRATTPIRAAGAACWLATPARLQLVNRATDRQPQRRYCSRRVCGCTNLARHASVSTADCGPPHVATVPSYLPSLRGSGRCMKSVSPASTPRTTQPRAQSPFQGPLRPAAQASLAPANTTSQQGGMVLGLRTVGGAIGGAVGAIGGALAAPFRRGQNSRLRATTVRYRPLLCMRPIGLTDKACSQGPLPAPAVKLPATGGALWPAPCDPPCAAFKRCTRADLRPVSCKDHSSASEDAHMGATVAAAAAFLARQRRQAAALSTACFAFCLQPTCTEATHDAVGG